jgi:protein-L-isoaspartate(D-aspartate) O-methyltransferase
VARTGDSASDRPTADSLDTELTLSAREHLVRGIERSEALDAKVAHALRVVPRHVFVPESLRDHAYDDGPLPIGEGQTISQPTVVAMMTGALNLKGDEVVLEVGTGSGYQAAVLSRLCRRVETIEIISSLADGARKALTRVGYDNVRVHVGDGYEGLPSLAPFDAIIITAAPPEIPVRLMGQLRDGGRLVAPIGPVHGIQDLILVEKHGDRVTTRDLGAVRFVPMVRKPAAN